MTWQKVIARISLSNRRKAEMGKKMAEKGKKFEIEEKVTFETLKTVVEVPVYVKFLSPIVDKKKMEKDADGKMVEKFITIAKVADLYDDGEIKEMVIPAVLKSIMEPLDYVNNGYAIVKHEKAQGKKYHTFGVDKLKL